MSNIKILFAFLLFSIPAATMSVVMEQRQDHRLYEIWCKANPATSQITFGEFMTLRHSHFIQHKP